MKVKSLFQNKFETFIAIFRKKYTYQLRRKLKNTNFSLIASNCNGGVVVHAFGLRFNSPFVNLSLSPKDFVELTKNFEYYMGLELIEYKDSNISYPIGLLGKIKINFVHYSSFLEAKTKWDERKKRINYDNLFFMLTERDGCVYEDLKEFDKIKRNKVVFTKKQYKDIKSSFCIKGYKNCGEVGFIMNYPKMFSIKQAIFQFDFVKWFNNSVV